MLIEENVKAVEQIFASIDEASAGFWGKAGIKCPSGCDKCCHGENIAASPLEYLPYSYNLYLNNQLEEKFWEFKNSGSKTCFLLESDAATQKGRCTQYKYRGIVCRLFGNSAIITKTGEKAFSGCRILKDQIADEVAFKTKLQHIAPVYSEYYMQLRAVENNYGGMLCSINEAILKAMEIVYFNTRNNEEANHNI